MEFFLNPKIQILFTFIIVSLAWPLFDLQLTEVHYILNNLNFGFSNFLFHEFSYIKKIVFFIFIFILTYLTFMQNFTYNVYKGIKANKLNVSILASRNLTMYHFYKLVKKHLYILDFNDLFKKII